MPTNANQPLGPGVSKTHQVKLLTTALANRRNANQAIAQAAADLASQRTVTTTSPTNTNTNTGGTTHAS